MHIFDEDASKVDQYQALFDLGWEASKEPCAGGTLEECLAGCGGAPNNEDTFCRVDCENWCSYWAA